jgi:hypothetical protein
MRSWLLVYIPSTLVLWFGPYFIPVIWRFFQPSCVDVGGGFEGCFFFGSDVSSDLYGWWIIWSLYGLIVSILLVTVAAKLLRRN